MWPDRESNPGPLAYESGALPTALCGPAAAMGDSPKGLKKEFDTAVVYEPSVFGPLKFNFSTTHDQSLKLRKMVLVINVSVHT